MPSLHAVLLWLRLLLAGLALTGWIGPAAAMGSAMEADTAHSLAGASHHDGGGRETASHRHAPQPAPHDAKACCAAACGPVVAPLASPLTVAAAVERPRQARPTSDVVPPGFDPATAKPPPRPVSF